MSHLFRLFIAIVLSLSIHAPIARAAPPTVATPAARFADEGRSGAFLLQRDGGTPQILHGADWAKKPLSPASTFKVALALIALETGALRSASEVIEWDGKPYPGKPEWQKDMALREAMQSSSEHYFGVLATRIGRERLAEWVQRVSYGNGRVGPDALRSWHDGVLTVSAEQQLDFIDRLRRGALPFSADTMSAVKAAMLDSQIGDRRVYGKTGTRFDGKGPGYGWWIGWVEGGKTPAASFVLIVELKTLEPREKRIALGKRLLRDSGALPAK
jgi:beta-lactamase class D